MSMSTWRDHEEERERIDNALSMAISLLTFLIADEERAAARKRPAPLSDQYMRRRVYLPRSTAEWLQRRVS